MNARHVALLLACTGALLATGCGYTADSQYPGGIRTVAVPIWTRGQEPYRRDHEIRFTQQLIKRIELDTPFKVVKREQADTLLTGTIERIEQQPMSFNPDTGRPRDIQATFTVSFKWEDLRDGKTLEERRNFRVASVYLPGEPYDEDFFRASEDLQDKLARWVVETMESQWGQEQF
jgi:hypothetical protein